MKDEHFVEIEKQAFAEFEPYQISSCHFCYKLLPRSETKVMKLKDETLQTVCKRCGVFYMLKGLFF